MTTIEASTTVERAMSFPLDSVVKMYRIEQGLSERVALEHGRELRRFLALCALNPDAGYGMAGAVDDLWHTLILCTEHYAAFCDAVAGQFIHHTPAFVRQPPDGGYERFLRDYELVFCERAPTDVWPGPVGSLPSEKCRAGDKCG